MWLIGFDTPLTTLRSLAAPVIMSIVLLWLYVEMSSRDGRLYDGTGARVAELLLVSFL